MSNPFGSPFGNKSEVPVDQQRIIQAMQDTMNSCPGKTVIAGVGGKKQQ
jgi:hypothetical protein